MEDIPDDVTPEEIETWFKTILELWKNRKDGKGPIIMPEK